MTSSSQAFSDAAAAMVGHNHVGDILGRLVRDCVDVTGASAVAILVTESDGRLALLSASSGAAADLEMLQVQELIGPCVDAIESGKAVRASRPEEFARWGDVGESILAAGFAAVHAQPMHWHGQVLGGLNMFFRTEQPEPPDEQVVRGFADVATIVTVHATELPADQVMARVQAAVLGRGLIEQAKGVLAEQLGLEIEQAHEHLEAMAAARGGSVTDTASDVIDGASAG